MQVGRPPDGADGAERQVKAARVLLDTGKLASEMSKETLRSVAASLLIETLSRLREEPDPLPVLRLFVRAVSEIAAQSEPTALALLDRLCTVATGDTADNIRRLIHEERTEGWSRVTELSTSTSAFYAADKVGL